MQNLNQLLLEAPDVVDSPSAVPLPPASSSTHAKGGYFSEDTYIYLPYPPHPEP